MFMCPPVSEWAGPLGDNGIKRERVPPDPMKNTTVVRLGTRGSKLALSQAGIVAGLNSRANPGTKVALVPIRTAGAAGRRGSGSEEDLKLAFTGEIDRRLLLGKIDIAVHSLKDVPSAIDAGLVIAAMPTRGDPRDALVADSGRNLNEIPEGSAVATSSIRRKVQMQRLRPDLRIVDIRGNVETRIANIKERGLEGVVLAAAGLQSLRMEDRVSQYFSTNEMMPAACQGIIGVEARRDDEAALRLSRQIDDPSSRIAGVCERAFIGALGGDCNFPAGAHARVGKRELVVVGFVANRDGSSLAKDSAVGSPSAARELGEELAMKLLDARRDPKR